MKNRECAKLAKSMDCIEWQQFIESFHISGGLEAVAVQNWFLLREDSMGRGAGDQVIGGNTRAIAIPEHTPS